MTHLDPLTRLASLAILSPSGEREDGRPRLTDPCLSNLIACRNRLNGVAMSFTAALRDLNKLNTFVRVAQRRSFTKAAAELRTRPSVISKRMKELEDALGFSLVNRSTHGLALTDAGEGLFAHCLEMLEDLDDHVVARRNLEAGPYGMLRVQAPSDFARHVLAPLAIEFAQRHPRVRLQLAVVADDATAAEAGVDVILAGRKPAVPGLVGHDLGPIRHVICASPRYLRKAGRPKVPQDLRAHNCLIDPSHASWPFRHAARPLLVEAKGSLASNSIAVLIEMALADCGIVRVPLHAVRREIVGKRLEILFKTTALSPEHMHAYVAKAKRLPAKTADFIGFLTSARRA